MIDKSAARQYIEQMLHQARSRAEAAGLRLDIEHQIVDVESERLQKLMQSNLESAKSQILAAIAAAKQLGLEEISFLNGVIKWSVDGEEAHGGPRFFEEWKGSSFDCYPADEEWEWLHGPNPPRKPYDYDGYESF